MKADRKKFFLNQRNKGAAIEKHLFVDRGCLEMTLWLPPTAAVEVIKLSLSVCVGGFVRAMLSTTSMVQALLSPNIMSMLYLCYWVVLK